MSCKQISFDSDKKPMAHISHVKPNNKTGNSEQLAVVIVHIACAVTARDIFLN